MKDETACGAAAPASVMPSGSSPIVSVPVQSRPSAMSEEGTSPVFSPVASGVGVEEEEGVGAATGALTGSLTDVGIDDAFINKVRDQVTPGTSALFLMTSDAVVDKVHAAMKGHEGELIFTNLSSEQEKALREVFAE